MCRNFIVDELIAQYGEDLFVVRDNVYGCLIHMPRHTVIEPILPSVKYKEANPIQCLGIPMGHIIQCVELFRSYVMIL